MRRLFYATSNPGKMMEARQIFRTVDLEILGPADVGLALDVPEPGTTLEENAADKARAYMDRLDDSFVVLGDDTGMEIDALNGEPGIHVRRWTGERMTDEAIIDYCLARMEGIPLEARGAQFRTVFAIGVPSQPVTLFDGTLRGVILTEADPLRIEGFPFESVFYVPEWDMLLGRLYELSAQDRAQFLTHRERALQRALPHIRGLLNGDSR